MTETKTVTPAHGRPMKDNTEIFFQSKIWPWVTIRSWRTRWTDYPIVSNNMT